MTDSINTTSIDDDSQYPDWLLEMDKLKKAEEAPPLLQFEKTDEDPKKRYKSREYKLACFIMGCLIQEEVVSTDDCADCGCSDMLIGIDIIATCLEGNLAEGFSSLPFDF